MGKKQFIQNKGFIRTSSSSCELNFGKDKAVPEQMKCGVVRTMPISFQYLDISQSSISL